jgi:enoyl-CoA hydratase/carnithine racemase
VDRLSLEDGAGDIAVLTLDRPEVMNAIDDAMLAALHAALDELQGDAAILALVLAGAGERAFCAGMDLKERAGFSDDDLRAQRARIIGLIRRLHELPIPTIAAVDGVALGGGFEIALACDLVVAARTARFALPESRRGVVASSGALFRAMRALPLNVARELLITGAVLDADRGYQVGFVNRVTEPGQALTVALELAEDVCACSPVSVAASLSALAAQHEADDAAGWELTARAVERVIASDDIKEGVSAFFEKRPPRWTGR